MIFDSHIPTRSVFLGPVSLWGGVLAIKIFPLTYKILTMFLAGTFLGKYWFYNGAKTSTTPSVSSSLAKIQSSGFLLVEEGCPLSWVESWVLTRNDSDSEWISFELSV